MRATVSVPNTIKLTMTHGTQGYYQIVLIVLFIAKYMPFKNSAAQ